MTKKDFIYFTKLLFNRLLARGWDPSYIKPIFYNAPEKIKIQSTNQHTLTDTNMQRNQLFLHFNYHPSDIPRHTIRKIYEEELKDVLHQELCPNTKVTVCYSRPKNIQDIVAKATLFQVKGKEISKYLRGEL